MPAIDSVRLSICCLLLFLGTPVAADDWSTTVSGRVTDWWGHPLPGAQVVVLDRHERQVAEMRADERGTYRIPGLDVFPFSLRVSFSGFHTATIPVDFRDKGAVVDVGLGVPTEGAVHVIAGTIRDENGKAVSDATVCIEPMLNHLDRHQRRTDRSGRFEDVVSAGGTYLVGAIAEGHVASAKAIVIAPRTDAKVVADLVLRAQAR